MARKIKVLIVDDSSTMRLILTSALAKASDIELVGAAKDAFEARRLIKELNPDVITLDIEMPGMSGLEFLERIMTLRPMPVIIVSTLSHRGSVVAIQALEIGAFDCVVKPNVDNASSFDELADKIRAAYAAAPAISSHSNARQAVEKTPDFLPADVVVAIGSSTGGLEALQCVLKALPSNCAPTVITQHMPAYFTKSMAERLDRTCPPSVAEAKDGEALEPGKIYVAPGGLQHLEIERGRCRLHQHDLVNGHRPSVDVLFSSVARHAGRRAIGVILTGMGNDGAQGLLNMKNAGAFTIGQDQATSVVYGMPKAAKSQGAVMQELPIHQIGPAIVRQTNKLFEGKVSCHSRSS